MKGLLRVIVALMFALSMASFCQAQDVNNDTIYKIIMGPAVKADGSCWIDVHEANEDGKAGELLGYSRVNAGIHENVPIMIQSVRGDGELVADPQGDEKNIDKFLIEIHTDGGEIGKFEPNGPDKALEGGWCTFPYKKMIGNSWGVEPLSEDELQNCGSEHPDMPERPCLDEVGGYFDLKGLIQEKVDP